MRGDYNMLGGSKEREWVCTKCGVKKKSATKPPIVCAPICKNDKALAHHWVWAEKK